MDFFPGRAIMRNAGFAKLPGKINLLPFMRPEEFHIAFFDITQKATHREDRFDILGEILDRFLKRMNAVFQIIFLF